MESTHQDEQAGWSTLSMCLVSLTSIFMVYLFYRAFPRQLTHGSVIGTDLLKVRRSLRHGDRICARRSIIWNAIDGYYHFRFTGHGKKLKMRLIWDYGCLWGLVDFNDLSQKWKMIFVVEEPPADTDEWPKNFPLTWRFDWKGRQGVSTGKGEIGFQRPLFRDAYEGCFVTGNIMGPTKSSITKSPLGRYDFSASFDRRGYVNKPLGPDDVIQKWTRAGKSSNKLGYFDFIDKSTSSLDPIKTMAMNAATANIHSHPSGASTPSSSKHD